VEGRVAAGREAGWPAPEQGHAHAWRVMLDALFLDAYACGVGRVCWHVGLGAVTEAIGERTLLTPGRGSGVADAWIAVPWGTCSTAADRVYTLEYSPTMLPPGAVRRPGWRAAWRRVMFPPRARALGAVMRLADALGRPAWHDRAFRRLPEAFVGGTLGHYRVTAWEPDRRSP
jgi:hypothetical protein